MEMQSEYLEPNIFARAMYKKIKKNFSLSLLSDKEKINRTVELLKIYKEYSNSITERELFLVGMLSTKQYQEETLLNEIELVIHDYKEDIKLVVSKIEEILK